MRIAITLCVLGTLLLPATLAAQIYGGPGPYSATTVQGGSPHSVLLPGDPGWRNYVNVADGPCGCSVPVRADCYDEHCPSCHCHPCCLLKKVARMLDCLLPCNKCGHGCGHGSCYHGCSLLAGCGVGSSCSSHCGPTCGHGCNPGCSCATPTCTTCATPSCSCAAPTGSTAIPIPTPPIPTPTDPFKDDPSTPVPNPTSIDRSIEQNEAHWNPFLRKSLVSAQPKVTAQPKAQLSKTERPAAKQPASAQSVVVAAATAAPKAPVTPAAPSAVAAKPQARKPEVQPAFAAVPAPPALAASAPPKAEPALLQTSHEEAPVEPARLQVVVSAPKKLVEPSTSEAIKDFEIPTNPLRR